MKGNKRKIKVSKSSDATNFMLLRKKFWAKFSYSKRICIILNFENTHNQTAVTFLIDHLIIYSHNGRK